MTSIRKFHYTELRVQIISEEPISQDADLSDIHYLTTEGGASGKVETVKEEEVDAPKAAEILLDQSSDPNFFGLDDEGNDIDEDDDDEEDKEDERRHAAIFNLLEYGG